MLIIKYHVNSKQWQYDQYKQWKQVKLCKQDKEYTPVT
jgi:hypothetical protein